jgi:hypothetical protein
MTEYTIHGAYIVGLERTVELDDGLEMDDAQAHELLHEELDSLGIRHGTTCGILDVDDIVEG